MKIYLVSVLGVTIWATCMTLLTLDVSQSKPDPPPTKLTPIKVIDSNKQVSYLSWECVTNE